MTEFVMVPVPADRVGDVYALLATGPATSEPTGAAASASEDEAEDNYEPWDAQSLRRFFKGSSPNMQAFLRDLAERSPATMTSTEAGKNLPRGAQSVAGMLGAAARRAWNHHNRPLPWNSWWQSTDDGGGTETVFEMTEEVAKAIKSVA
jgi:hypothetical protein